MSISRSLVLFSFVIFAQPILGMESQQFTPETHPILCAYHNGRVSEAEALNHCLNIADPMISDDRIQTIWHIISGKLNLEGKKRIPWLLKEAQDDCNRIPENATATTKTNQMIWLETMGNEYGSRPRVTKINT